MNTGISKWPMKLYRNIYDCVIPQLLVLYYFTASWSSDPFIRVGINNIEALFALQNLIRLHTDSRKKKNSLLSNCNIAVPFPMAYFKHQYILSEL